MCEKIQTCSCSATHTHNYSNTFLQSLPSNYQPPPALHTSCDIPYFLHLTIRHFQILSMFLKLQFTVNCTVCIICIFITRSTYTHFKFQTLLPLPLSLLWPWRPSLSHHSWPRRFLHFDVVWPGPLPWLVLFQCIIFHGSLLLCIFYCRRWEY